MNKMIKQGELILCWQKFLFDTGFNFNEVVHVAGIRVVGLFTTPHTLRVKPERNLSSIVVMFTPFLGGSHYFAIKCINANDVIAISL